MKKIISGFAAVLVGALLLGFSITPALAATKLVEIKARGITDFFFDPEAGVCGATALNVFVTIHELTIIVWDNGRAKFSASLELHGFDADGVHRVSDHATVSENFGPTGLPFTTHFTTTGVCTPESGVPGFQWHATFGMTVNENGELVSVRILEIGDPPGP